MLKVYLHQDPEEGFIDRLKSALDDNIDLVTGMELPEPADYHIIISGRPEKKHLTASPKLRTLIIPWSGLPFKTRELLLDFPHIAVHNIHHNAAPTAETAVGLMLAAARRLIPVDGHLRRNDWSPCYDAKGILLLEGKTALIAGFGAIGQRIARICDGLGMKVIGLTKSKTGKAKQKIKIYSVDHLGELLTRANVLFITLPLTTETRGLIGTEELKKLPDDSIVVNIARGPIVDEKTLYDELKTGRIRAGLDVWYSYPDSEEARKSTPPSRYPYNELENVVMSSHMGGHSDQTEALRIEHLAHLLNLAARGEPLPDRVDIYRGY